MPFHCYNSRRPKSALRDDIYEHTEKKTDKHTYCIADTHRYVSGGVDTREGLKVFKQPRATFPTELLSLPGVFVVIASLYTIFYTAIPHTLC